MFVSMLLPWLFACTNSNKDTSAVEPESCFALNPSLLIGEGEQEFVPFSDPPEAMIVHGPQGGWHVVASIRIENMESIIEGEYHIVHQQTGVLVSENTFRIAVIPDGVCSGYYPGMFGYISVSDLHDGELDTPPELLGGETLEMIITVNDCLSSMADAGECDREQRSVTDSLEVTGVLDPVDQD